MMRVPGSGQRAAVPRGRNAPRARRPGRPGAAAARCRPAGAEGLHGLVHVAHRRLGLLARRHAGQVAQHGEDAGIGAVAARQPRTDGGQHVDGLVQQRLGLVGVDHAQELQEQRHMVRQFRHHGFKAMVAVGLQQVHHGLAPVAAFAVHVLEQVQRVRAVAVEGGDVGFLQRDQGLAAQPGGQGSSVSPAQGARPARRRSRARRPAAPARGS